MVLLEPTRGKGGPVSPSITNRFAFAFYKGLWGTVRDEILTICVFLAGGAYWLLRTGFRGGWSWQGFRDSGWEGLSVTVWVVCFLTAYHAIRAASQVVNEIAREKAIGEHPERRVITPWGEPFTAKPSGLPRWKPWGAACVIVALCGIASYLMWDKAKSREIAEIRSQPAPHGFEVIGEVIDNGERVYGLGLWNIQGESLYPVGMEMYLRVRNSGSMADMVDSIEVDVATNDGKLEPLVEMDPLTPYEGAYPNLARLEIPLLKTALFNRNLEPGAYASGWMWFDYPRTAAIQTPDFRWYGQIALHRDFKYEPGDTFIFAAGERVWNPVLPYLPVFRLKITSVGGNAFIVPITSSKQRWSDQLISWTVKEKARSFDTLQLRFLRQQ